MKTLGKDAGRLEKEASSDPKKSFLKFEFDDFKIDFLPEIKVSIHSIIHFQIQKNLLGIQ